MESENLSIADSSTAKAIERSEHIEALIAEGKTQDEALAIVDQVPEQMRAVGMMAPLSCCICQDDAPLILPGEDAANEEGTALGHVCDECHALARGVCVEPKVDGVTSANMRLIRELRRQRATIAVEPTAFAPEPEVADFSKAADFDAAASLAEPPFTADVEAPEPEPTASRLAPAPERSLEDQLRDQLGVGGTVEITDHGLRVKSAGVVRFGHGTTIQRALFDLRCPGQLPGAGDNMVSRDG